MNGPKRSTCLLLAAGLAVSGVALCWAAFGPAADVRLLSQAQMQAAVGLQGSGGSYCAPTSGCNGYPEPSCDTQCTYCDNWVGEGWLCTQDPLGGSVPLGGASNCGQLPEHDCGTVWQGVCNYDCGYCDMNNDVNMGSCGVVPQCQ